MNQVFEHTDARKRTLNIAQHAGRVAGREVLAEEFFGLFELLHRLQQVGQAVDAIHGVRVLVPQLEAACETSLKGVTESQTFF